MTNAASDKKSFSRASLDITYNLLRQKEPQLSLTIRNILFQQPEQKMLEQLDNKYTDNFVVELDTHLVRKIVETLMIILEESKITHAEDNTSLFRPILIQSIITEWTVLAKNMFDEFQSKKDNK